ncbi:MAG: hypothetical protein OQK99_02995 [Gammaproteobacteria bacterium]|jgi:hypothetical protein|nr:hypothetical protein [Gammaproteobacteria bacterium]
MWPLNRKKAKPGKSSEPVVPKEPPRASRKAEAVKVLEVLDAPELSIADNEAKQGFDPYDTGVFDRSKLWESWQNQD